MLILWVTRTCPEECVGWLTLTHGAPPEVCSDYIGQKQYTAVVRVQPQGPLRNYACG